MALIESFKKAKSEQEKGVNFWLVGSYWHNEKPRERLLQFKQEGVWINGHGEDKFGNRVDKVKEGDIVICKSTYAKGKKNYLKIKGAGRVVKNLFNGTTLKVNWDDEPVDIDLEGYGYYRDTIQQIKEQDFEIIVEIVFGNIRNTEKAKETGRLSLKHSLSTNNNEEELISRGYSNQGLIGYIDNEHYSNNKPLYRRYLKSTKDYSCFFQSNFEEELNKLGYEKIILGYVSQGSFEGSIPLNRFYFPENIDHLYCTNPSRIEIDKFINEDESSIEGFENAHLRVELQANKIPLYVYSKTPDILLFEALIQPETDADILSDNPSEIDDLGRKEIMEIIRDKVEGLWQTLRHDESYTILLNGEWGSGKSSMLFYFKNQLKEKNWEVIEYNAWENQHLPDQWWILVNKVSKHLSSNTIANFSLSHKYWTFKLQNNHTIIVVVLIIIFLGSGFGLADSIINTGSDENNVKFFGGLIGLLGSIWVTFSGIVKNVFKKKVSTADLAKIYTDDPYTPIKKRFNEITAGRKIAIFIDDMDRCEVKPTIELLEGIQNLFKKTKVLYVIAADGNWVSNCFDKKYSDFDSLTKEGHSIGNQFLQKAFQMIVDVPKMGKEQQETLWKKYLGVQSEITQLDEAQNNDAEIDEAKSIEELKMATQTAGINSRAKAARKVEEIVEQRKSHLLMKFSDLAPNNPRQMKRLINQFVVKFQTIFIAGTQSEVSEDALVRYIIFSAKYPDYDKDIRQGKSSLKELSEKNDGLKNLVGTELTDEMIREYL